MPKYSSNVLVLASGGLDSTACIKYYLMRGYQPDLLWIDYGQQASNPELEAITQIAKYYGAPLKVVKVTDVNWKVEIASGKYEYLGRNSLLASIGVSSFAGSAGLVAMGIHSNTIYPDCSSEFLKTISEISKIVSSGRIEMDFPLRDWTKGDVVHFCRNYQIPIDLTYSCLTGAVPPCGNCASCQERTQLGV